MTSRSRGEGVTQSMTNSTDRLRECMTKGEGVQKNPKISVTLFMDGPKWKRTLSNMDLGQCKCTIEPIQRIPSWDLG